MRNLKKLLCLVLAVAMMASMFVVGASAAEKVYSETAKYPEAAAVITADAVKVMDGFEDGTMRYDAPVTREQAATIICKILLGTTAAENLKTGTAPFADVPATRWSAGYIAYLKAQGIVSGVTDTTFNPTAGVTGVQFAKMLLSAVGYGANKEFDGAAWDINTISQANASGVFTSTKAADLTAGATREECMLYAFNTMTKVPTVKYNKTFDSYYTGTSAITSANGTFDETVADPSKTDNPYLYTLAYTNFKLKKSMTEDTDDFGRPSASWIANNNTVVAENVANAQPIATANGAINSTILYNALGKSVVTALNKGYTAPTGTVGQPGYTSGSYDDITVYVDGDVVEPDWAEIASGKLTNATITGAGAVTEIYLDNTGDTPVVTLVVVYEHYSEVSRVVSGATPSLRLKDGSTVDGENVNITGYAKDDKVIYTTGKNGVVTLRKADAPVVGEYTATNATFRTYTIGGAVYSKNYASDFDMTTLTLRGTYDLYLDSFGAILYAEEHEDTTVSNDYVYVVKAEVQEYDSSSIIDGTQDAKVALSVVYPEGGTEVVYYAVKRESKASDRVEEKGWGYYIEIDGEKNYITSDLKVESAWYTYTKNSAGNITLKGIGDKNVGTLTGLNTTTNNRNFGATVNAGANTVLNVVNEDGNVSTYTGIKNFPTTESNSWPVVYTFSGNNALVINAYSGTSSITSTIPELAYVVAAGNTVEDGTEYTVNIDGKVETIVVTDALVAGNVITLAQDSEGNYSVEDVMTAFDGDEGLVNATTKIDFVGNGVPADEVLEGRLPVNYGVLDFTTFATSYYEHATVADVDPSGYFYTVKVDEDEEGYDGTVEGRAVASYSYDFDANTKIVDITGQGATSIAAGDIFVAYVNNAATTNTQVENYCTYIWIVG